MIKHKRNRIAIISGVVIAILLILFLIARRAITQRTLGNYFDSDRINIHYTDEGEGTPIILLHGFAVNADLNWRRPGITEKLSRDFRVISMDMRGHGLSDKPHIEEAYGIEMGEDVIRLMNHLDIDKTPLAGYSLGGLVSLYLAGHYEDCFYSVASLGMGWESVEGSPFMEALPRLVKDLESGKGVGPLSGYLGGDREKPGYIHTLWVKTMTRYFSDVKAMAAMIRGLPDLTLSEDQLRDISIPILSMVGDQDPLAPGVYALEGKISDHTIHIFSNEDHMSTVTNREFQDYLSEFFRSR